MVEKIKLFSKSLGFKAALYLSFLLIILCSLFLLDWSISSLSAANKTSQLDISHEAQANTFEYTTTHLSSLESYHINCKNQQIDLANPLAQIAADIENSALLYNTQPLTDCSGVFHRVLIEMKSHCPDYPYPSPQTYRTTRDLAYWYHKQGKLILIKDVIASVDLIKPGAVLFYGQQNLKYKDFTAKDLFKQGTGINHMGVVVKVHKDKANQVTHYELLHGHGKTGKTAASVTNYHRRNPTRAGYPPFGNGNEQWLAFALLIPRHALP